MKLLVLGASGQCGQWTARLAVQRGYAVTAFVRPATAFTPPPSVTLIRGEALSASDVSAVMIGHDAVPVVPRPAAAESVQSVFALEVAATLL